MKQRLSHRSGQLRTDAYPGEHTTDPLTAALSLAQIITQHEKLLHNMKTMVVIALNS